jgi:uncharacterized membrane protein affecting hemolysin expression
MKTGWRFRQPVLGNFVQVIQPSFQSRRTVFITFLLIKLASIAGLILTRQCLSFRRPKLGGENELAGAFSQPKPPI